MTQFPKIQARFNAALAIIEEAPTGGGDPKETKKFSDYLAKAQNAANAAADDLKSAVGDAKSVQSEVEAAKREAEKAKAALKKAQGRVKVLEGELAEKDDRAEAQRTAMIKQIDALDKARANSEENLDKARQYNKHLKKLNNNLREANEKNVANPDLINKSLETELEQIKAQRDLDLETVNGILARLTPLVEGA